MKRISRTLVLVLAMLMVLQPVLSLAGTGARVIPQGKISILEEGKEVTQFQSELPLPEGTMMLCNGSCVVQTQNLQLVAQDRAVFALAEGKARWDLTVKSGQVDFAMRPDAKPVSFHTPHDTIQTERAIVPASSGSMVRGSIKVSETESVMSVQEGALQVMSPDGTQAGTTRPGHSPGGSTRYYRRDCQRSRRRWGTSLRRSYRDDLGSYRCWSCCSHRYSCGSFQWRW